MKHVAVLVSAAASLLLGACAGSDFFYNNMINSRNITLDEVDATTGLYRVTVLNGIDVGWDGGLRADREKAVAFLFKKKCSKIEILSDVPMEMGTHTLSTMKKIKYSMTVKCTSI